jgi:hypothetical protein
MTLMKWSIDNSFHSHVRLNITRLSEKQKHTFKLLYRKGYYISLVKSHVLNGEDLYIRSSIVVPATILRKNRLLKIKGKKRIRKHMK